MRAFFLCAFVSLLWAQTGCFAVDEIDKANKLLDSHSANRNPAALARKAAAANAAAAQAPAGPAAEPGWGEWWAEHSAQIAEWWRQALEEEPVGPDPDDGIVSCTIGAAVSFKRQSDCELRGGRFSRATPPVPAES